MQTRSHPSPVAFVFRAVALACLACAVGRAQHAPPDVLSAQIQRFAHYLDGHASTDASFVQVKQGCRPLLVMARQAIADGRRLAAAYRLAQVSGSMAGIVKQLGYEHPDQAALEAAWREVDADLKADATAAACRSIRPAALRALAEAAAPQVHGYHAASLDYGRATMPEAGLFYLGAALGSRDLVTLLHRLREPTKGSEPELRAIAGEIDDLECEMLLAYRPPLSLDRHGEFVAAHGALQEAKDLDASGMRHGALLRYLQAAIRFAPLRADQPPAPSRRELRTRLDAAATELRTSELDHSLGAMLVEIAAAEVANAADDAPTPTAVTIARDALQRYRAAIAGAPARPAPRAPELTVTLVRWPFG